MQFAIKSPSGGSGWNTSRLDGMLLKGSLPSLLGAIAGSISLVGFGADSFIEVTSGTALLWRNGR